MNYDTIKTRQAILIGSLIPLVLYTIWEGVFLGVIDLSNANESSKFEVVSVLGKTGGPIVNDLVKLFSLCAICSSMAGASISLIDFFQDAISKLSSKSESEGVSVEEATSSVSKTRVLSTFLALAPPVLLAYSYPDIFLVALEEAGLLGGLCLTVHGTPGMNLISSVYAADLKLYDTRMRECSLSSDVSYLLMLYPHMENLITERVIVMYDEDHLVELDECLFEFLGPLLGIDKVFPVISQWRAENMPPGARRELRKIKLALLEKARAVLEETRRAYKAGEELTLKQMKTIAKLDKKYEADRDLWERYKNGEVLPIEEEVRISAILEGGEKGGATNKKAHATAPHARNDEQKAIVDSQLTAAETRKMSNRVQQLKEAVDAGKGVDVVKCNRNKGKDSCGDLLYVEENSCIRDFPTAPPKGTTYRIQKSCSCCQHKAYIFEERLSKAETNRLYKEFNAQLEERTNKQRKRTKTLRAERKNKKKQRMTNEKV